MADQYRAAAKGANDPSTPISWNKYSYVLGDPINHTDRRGMFLDAEACLADPDACVLEDEELAADNYATYGGTDDDSSDEAAAPTCDQLLTGAISAFLIGKKSPLATDAADFVSIGDKYNVDPRLIVAIAGLESAFGTSHAATADNNPFGLLHRSKNGRYVPIVFSSVDSAINSVGKTPDTHIYADNQSSVAALYSGLPGAYCSTAECKPKLGQTASRPAQTVAGFLTALGGNPNKLGSPCDPQ